MSNGVALQPRWIEPQLPIFSSADGRTAIYTVWNTSLVDYRITSVAIRRGWWWSEPVLAESLQPIRRVCKTFNVMRSKLLRLLCAASIASSGVLLARAPIALAQAATCVGDCRNDGAVTVDELLTGVNIALGNAPLSACDVFDANHDNQVTVDELLTAVNNALNGCPAPATPAAGSGAAETAAPLAVDAFHNIQIIDFGFIAGSGGGADLPGQLRRTASGTTAGTASCTIPDFSLGCADGTGRLTVNCVQNRLTVTYAACRAVSGGVAVVRTGTFVQQVTDANYCQCTQLPDLLNPSAPSDIPVTQTFSGAPEFVEAFSGGKLARAWSLALTRSVQPHAGGCMGLSRTETLDGSLHYTCDPAVDADCSEATGDVTLRPRRLQVDRQSAGSPCMLTTTLDGALDVINAGGAGSFQQSFQAFRLTQTRQSDGSSMVTEDGTMTVDCLGALAFETPDRNNEPLLFKPADVCPSHGLLAVSAPASVGGGAAASADTSIAVPVPPTPANAASVAALEGYHETKFRAANGPVYQVLQNVDGAKSLGAEDVRITTVVGSLDSANGCSGQPGGVPEAVVSAVAGKAFPLSGVFVSDVFSHATAPCFNPNAEDGTGVVCIGPDCNPGDCVCMGNNCDTFTIRNAASLSSGTAGIRPASLVDMLSGQGNSVCRSTAAGSAAYGFGSTNPTTALPALCAPVPTDGFTLHRGETAIVAYDAPLLTRFDAGSAGFFVDHDGQNTASCTGTDRVVGTAQIDSNPIPPPRVRFTRAGGLEFNFNGVFDANGRDVIDKGFASCLPPVPLQCLGSPTPTPTPTPRRTPRCSPRDLGSRDPVTVPIQQNVTTAGLPNILGGASCGDGGNHAPDVAYQYVAPVDGYYTIDTLDSQFDTLLYVRDYTRDLICTDGELACNDDANETVSGSQINLSLQAGQRILIVVDGFGTASGNALLRVQRSAGTPTPTPTPTPDVSSRPDLVVTAFTAPASGIVGVAIAASTTVENVGGSDAGAFRVAVVLALDPGLSTTVSELDCDVNVLAKGASTQCSGQVTVPVSLTDGSYYVGVIADSGGAIVERDESNNVQSGQILLTGGTRPTATATFTLPATATPTITRTPTRPPTITPTPPPTATPTPTPSRTVKPTGTPTPTPQAVCGNGVVESGEDCDDGGTCIGGSNAGSQCTSEAQCVGTGVCAAGAKLGTACTGDADCPSGRCVHCVPQGGDQCAANCTSETTVGFPLITGQIGDGIDIQPGTSGFVIHGDTLTIPLVLSGSESLVIGKQRDGQIPVVIKAASVQLGQLPISTLACACVRGLALKTCGGTILEADGVTASTDCTTNPGACAGKNPCTAVAGPDNSAMGTIGCSNLSGVNFSVVQNSGGPFGFPGPAISSVQPGSGGPGSALIVASSSLGAVVGACSGSSSDYGPDGLFCTDDDPAASRGRPTIQVLTTGTACATVLNANGMDSNDVGPFCSTGVPTSCSQIRSGSTSGAALATAFTLLSQPTTDDAVITSIFVAQ